MPSFRWFVTHATLFSGMTIASAGLFGVMNPEAFHHLAVHVVSERVGFLFLAMGGIIWLDYVTKGDLG